MIQQRAFGWTISYTFPWNPVLATSLLALLAGQVAAVLPLVLARRQTPAAALRDE